MQQVNPEAIKGNKAENGDMQARVEHAHMDASSVEMQANQAESDLAEITMALERARAAAERRESAEKQGEGKEREISELSGGAA